MTSREQHAGAKDFLAERPTPALNQTADDLNQRFAAVDRCFGSQWLEENGSHPLQILWRRRDPLATIELLNFGNAIMKMEKIDFSWTKTQSGKIKGGSKGERDGAIFEILALSLFPTGSCEIIPAPESQPGYDATLKLRDGSPVLVSLKNHGRSTYEDYFLKNASEIDQAFQDKLRALSKTGIEVRIIAPECLQSDANWAALRIDLEKCVDALEKSVDITLGGNWSIVVKNMNNYGELSGRHLTSGFFIASRIYKNEQDKFIEDIRKGFDNLVRQTQDVDLETCRVVFLRLSQTASIPKCVDWTRWYFSQFPEDPIAMVILYQTTVTTSSSGDQSSVSHYIVPVVGPRYARWSASKGVARKLPGFSMYVGTVENEPIRSVITDGQVQVDMSEFYNYQRADIFKILQLAEGAAFEVSNPATGILVHTELIHNGQSIQVISPSSYRFKDLLLLP